jgi:bis(5'-nucleosyl)-tetraphosphatase (symmetrical)
MANFAIGDIHGCFHTFNSLLEKISFNNNSDMLWLVGDIVNRGKNSLEVIDWCFKKSTKY